jgi:hypothetical protein
MEGLQQEPEQTEQQGHREHLITLTECPAELCAVYYTDTWSQSLLIVCRNPKHTTAVADTDTEDIEKVKGMDKLASQTKPQQNIGTSKLVTQQDSGVLRD